MLPILSKYYNSISSASCSLEVIYCQLVLIVLVFTLKHAFNIFAMCHI